MFYLTAVKKKQPATEKNGEWKRGGKMAGLKAESLVMYMKETERMAHLQSELAIAASALREHCAALPNQNETKRNVACKFLNVWVSKAHGRVPYLSVLRGNNNAASQPVSANPAPSIFQRTHHIPQADDDLDRSTNAFWRRVAVA